MLHFSQLLHQWRKAERIDPIINNNDTNLMQFKSWNLIPSEQKSSCFVVVLLIYHVLED